ncbi:unnamed protein product [Nesidiocoris tenuis]|uniref:Ubiquitin-conjugating enzyme E2-18 kDa n=1 Tax=Nesidiocoris tenuis TaxID=355587 RepID=A0A6H5GMF6_9HEMI|nr:unnamed protein product [Nesidiocoris tenuis]
MLNYFEFVELTSNIFYSCLKLTPKVSGFFFFKERNWWGLVVCFNQVCIFITCTWYIPFRFQELNDIKTAGIKSFRDVTVAEGNLLSWTGVIVPENPPFNKGAFRIEITFPAEYPFKPPKISFKTKIYHPNIDEKGQVCLPIISAENWKPATKTEQVIQALIQLVNDPEPDHPLRADLAEEFTKDKRKFFKNAEDYTKKFGEKRPAD